MSSDTKQISLKDAVSFIVDNRGRTAPTAATGIALIATNCVNNKDLYPQRLNLRYVSKETYDTWFRAHPKPGDILLTNKGSQNGAVCLVPNQVDFCIAQDMVALRADSKNVYPLYLFAALRSEIVQQRMKALNVDAVIPHLKKTDFDKLFIPVPDYPLQEWIGDFYFELSERIEILRESNSTLEAIAQALFKSWFVDFDPVRAKAGGRMPEGLDAVTAALFPGAFEQPPFENVPVGWSLTTIAQRLTTMLGGTPSRKNPAYWTNGTIPWINSGKTNDFRIVQCSELITEAGLRSSSAKMLPKRTTVLAITGATLGQVSITEIECCANQSVVAVPATREYPTEFLYFWIKQNIGQLMASQTGGAQQHINKGNVDELILLRPSPQVMDAYKVIAAPIFDRIALQCEQAHGLAVLRDAVLPRLISGQLRIEEAAEALLPA